MCNVIVDIRVGLIFVIFVTIFYLGNHVVLIGGPCDGVHPSGPATGHLIQTGLTRRPLSSRNWRKRLPSSPVARVLALWRKSLQEKQKQEGERSEGV